MRYDYVCPQCQWFGELNMPVKERDNAYCPQCSAKLRRIFNPQSLRITIPCSLHTDPVEVYTPLWENPKKYAGWSRKDLQKLEREAFKKNYPWLADKID